MATTRDFPVQGFCPRLTSGGGNSFFTPVAFATAATDLDLLTFKQGADGRAAATVKIPDGLAATPNAKIAIRWAINATTGSVRFNVRVRPVALAESIDQALTAIGVADFSVAATAYTVQEAAFTLPTTPAPWPIVDAESLMVDVERVGSADTALANVHIVGVDLRVDLA
jgi:hypothetical protein